MKKILVVGGAGFIGSHVNKMLASSGYETIVFDNLYNVSENPVTSGTFVYGDLADTALLQKLFSESKIDAVMHFAAFIDIRESMENPTKYYKNNVANTLNLLHVMLDFNIKNFIFSSSASVYGLPQTTLIPENHPRSPISPYGASKYMVERVLEDYDKSYGLRYSSLRYFNAAGGDPEGLVKNFKEKESNLIPIVLHSLKKGDGSVTIFGTDYETRDGTCVRDYVHVCDISDAHILAMQELFNGGPSTIYNLGNGHGTTIREVIQAIEKTTKRKVMIKEGPRRLGDPSILLADPKKAIEQLGWSPKYPKIESMIEHAWNAI